MQLPTATVLGLFEISAAKWERPKASPIHAIADRRGYPSHF
jgi:hypothetical protein